MNTKGELIAQDLEEYDVLTPILCGLNKWPDSLAEGRQSSIRKTVAKSKVTPRILKESASADFTVVLAFPLTKNGAGSASLNLDGPPGCRRNRMG